MANKAIEDALKKYNETYYKKVIDKDIINTFGNELKKYTETINAAFKVGENEEYFKNIINNFLKTNFYQDHKYTINTMGNIDSAIKEDNKLMVLIETKKFDNKTEMLKPDNINKKALWEIIYYFLENTRDYSGKKVSRYLDAEIRRAIITDTVNWYFFDATDLDKICSGYLENQYYKYKNCQLTFSNDNSKFYELISVYFNEINITEKLDYVFFNLRDLYKNKSEWKNIYKLYSNYYLLKDNYIVQTSTHQLNSKFYKELLYIMGLKEQKENNKLLIRLNTQIKNTLADQVYKKYVYDKEVDEKEATERTFELVIIWINRLLFIKLFENQLMVFNNKEEKYQILNNNKIKSFDDLQNLFFDVLGRKIENRDDNDFFNQFKEIPYLNSSLFERQEIETKDININEIKNHNVEKCIGSVLSQKNSTEIPLLKYIIDFLNSYNFGIDLNNDGTYTKGKEIIDASVLGLIFEKINGYKDGAFFTPSMITENMCKKTIENLIIKKVNTELNWKAKKLEDIRFSIENANSLEITKKVNDIINSLKICDPAVGSGHFLVSALNRIIAIKAELGVLFEYNSNNLLRSYDIFVSDDILNVVNAQGDDFYYNPMDAQSQRVQETLFNEKRIIIENCLFGVDLNPKAVSICQLRLWIELLKNAYYKNHIMETLPNIDINIKVGNSLVNKLSFEEGKKLSNSLDSSIDISPKDIVEYKNNVNYYKSISDKVRKKEIKLAISNLKNKIYSNSIQTSIYASDNKVLEDDYKLFKDSFEWAFEFPEILGKNGEFLGFDCIIGNPPYGASLDNLSKDYCKKKYEDVHMRTPDTYIYFISLAERLVKSGGSLSFIVPNNLLFQNECQKTRHMLLTKNTICEITNIGDNAFEDASVPTCIFYIMKERNKQYTFSYRDYRFEKLSEINWENHKIKLISNKEVLELPAYVIGIDTTNLNIINKINKKSITFGSIAKEVASGIGTGGNNAFLVSTTTVDFKKLEEDILRPILAGRNINKYSIDYHGDKIIYSTKGLETDTRPHIMEHLAFYKDKLEKKRETKKGLIPWWSLHWPRKVELFEQDKIILRQTADHIIAAYDIDNYYVLDSVLVFEKADDCELDYYLLTGILNSNINNYMYKILTQESERAFAQVKPINVRKLVIPKLQEDKINEISNIVCTIMKNLKVNREYDYTNEENKIDNILFQYYELTSNEIKVIENAFKDN